MAGQDTPLVSPQDRARIAAAIRAAETRTSGEIYCVLARQSDGYFFPAAAMLAGGVFIASLLAAFVLRWMWADIGLVWLVILQIAAWAAGLALLAAIPALRIAMTPKSLRYRRAHANALRQFLAHNVHVTRSRTGVLVFVSVAERYAEVVADAAIDAKVPQERWNAVVAALIVKARSGSFADGFVEAAGSVGDLLAEHFPIGAGDVNELDDHLVEI